VGKFVEKKRGKSGNSWRVLLHYIRTKDVQISPKSYSGISVCISLSVQYLQKDFDEILFKDLGFYPFVFHQTNKTSLWLMPGDLKTSTSHRSLHHSQQGISENSIR